MLISGMVVLFARSWRLEVHVLLGCALAACSAYDASLVDGDKFASAAGLGGSRSPTAGGSSAGAGAGGAGGTAGSMPPVEQPDAGPGDVPPPPLCGDGEVQLSEKCDIAIPEGQPGACPKTCPALQDCVPRRLEGSNCEAECILLDVMCIDDDGCCSASCNNETDNDCSANCGDGTLDANETCEPGSEDAPCKMLSDCDDSDECTTDALIGSTENCNVDCSHTVITATVMDGCCQENSNHNMDPDCPVICGNGATEEGEECDGGEACTEDCMLMHTEDQDRCLDLLPDKNDKCDVCSCLQCTMEQLTCRASGTDATSMTRDMHCSEVTQCANANDCVRDACYCLPSDVYPFCGGPCFNEINSARDAEPGGGTVLSQQANPGTAIARAIAISDCNTMRCADDCP